MGPTKKKLLVVDDELETLRLLEFTLRRKGYEVFTARNGTEALEKVQQERPDLIILDVMMPDMDGLEVCRRLRAMPQTARLPILMLSALGRPSDKVTGLRTGADDYIAKPVHLEELLARVEVLLLRAGYAPTPRARVLAFLGAKGGVGTTTVAINVAAALSEKGASVVLADLRPYLGTVCLTLKLRPHYDLSELLEMDPAEVTERAVASRLVTYTEGLKILASPQSFDAYGEISGEHVEALLEVLEGMAEYVILDLPTQPSGANQAAVKRSRFAALVTEPEPTSVACAGTVLSLLRGWGISGELTGLVVVNRTHYTLPMTRPQIESQVSSQIMGIVPPAPEACQAAVHKGAPLILTHPEHIASEALKELAERLGAEEIVPPRF